MDDRRRTAHAPDVYALNTVRGGMNPALSGGAKDFVLHGQTDGTLKDVSVSRLACLFRHWTWADEARVRFEHDLSRGWDHDENLLADTPFGAYYHWCVLCGFTEAVLAHRLLPGWQLVRIGADLDASLPWLRTCREWLIDIPSSLESHPRVVDLLRDDEMLDRLRRLHAAFGEALRDEQMTRDLEWLLYEH